MRDNLLKQFLDKKILVLMGGYSSEREISLQSGQTVLQALKQAQLQAEGFDIKDTSDLASLAQKEFDIAFIALHGKGGEDGAMQGVLEWLGKPYTGSGVLASSLAMDKVQTKKVWLQANLPTPAYIKLTPQSEWPDVRKVVGEKCVVKASHEGSSIGVYLVESAREFESAKAQVFEIANDAFAETWIDGPEYTVAIVGQTALPVIGLKPSAAFYDYDAKYVTGDTQYLLPSGLSATQELSLQQLARQAFDELGCQGWGRVDFMMGQDGKFWLLEVNTVPGMTKHSLVPKAAQNFGWAFSQLLLHILAQALPISDRHNSEVVS